MKNQFRRLSKSEKQKIAEICLTYLPNIDCSFLTNTDQMDNAMLRIGVTMHDLAAQSATLRIARERADAPQDGLQDGLDQWYLRCRSNCHKIITHIAKG